MLMSASWPISHSLTTSRDNQTPKISESSREDLFFRSPRNLAIDNCALQDVWLGIQDQEVGLTRMVPGSSLSPVRDFELAYLRDLSYCRSVELRVTLCV
jgi:hypothetical protein